MTNEEREALSGMTESLGWKIYMKFIDDRFQRELLSLRKKKKDSAFDKANGFMDGLSFAKSVCEEELSEDSQNLPQEGGEKEK